MRWLEEGRRLKEFKLTHCKLAERVAESNSRMGRYVRYRTRRWAEFVAWAGR